MPKLLNINNFKAIVPENTARRIIPRRGLPREECAHGNPWPGGIGNTCGPLPIMVVVHNNYVVKYTSN